MTPERRPVGWRSLLAAAAAYAAATVAFTWPALPRLSTHVFGGPWDSPMFLWNVWWAPKALFVDGSNPLFTRHLFFPEGTSLVINTHSLLPAIASAPLQSVFGLVPAFNLMILLTFVLSGLGAFGLAHEATGNRRAAFVAGAAFAFGHIRVSQIPFFNLIQTELLVFFAWALWRAHRTGSRRAALAAGALGAAILWTDYNLLFLTAFFAAAWLIGSIVTAPAADRPLRPVLSIAGIIAGVTLLGGAPLLVLIARELASAGSYVTKLASYPYQKSVPLVRYLLRGPLEGSALGTHYGIGEASYLGTIVLVLAIVAILSAWRVREVRFWTITAGAFLLVSLGPWLNLSGPSLPSEGGLRLPVPLPFFVLRSLPVINEVRTAHRYALVGWMAISVLAAFGWRAVLARIEGGVTGPATAAPRRRRVGLAATVLVSTILVADFAQVPFPMLLRLPEVPVALHAIADDPRDVCVVEFPSGRKGNPMFSWYQTVHGKPVYRVGQTARTAPDLKLGPRDAPVLWLLSRIWERRAEAAGADSVLDVPGGAQSVRAAIADETRRHGIGWVVFAWADRATMSGRENPPDPGALEAADRLLRDLLPVEETFTVADADEVARWYALAPEDRPSSPCIWRVYRLDPS